MMMANKTHVFLLAPKTTSGGPRMSFQAVKDALRSEPDCKILSEVSDVRLLASDEDPFKNPSRVPFVSAQLHTSFTCDY